MRSSKIERVAAVVGLTVFLTFGAGCTERQGVTGAGPLPVAGTAYPKPAGSDVAVAKSPPEDIQELRVGVAYGRFDSDRYSAQSRPTRIIITTQGGPYTLSIEGVSQPQPLAANTTTEVSLTLPNPGDYTMRLSGAAEATAVLNVRPVGGR